MKHSFVRRTVLVASTLGVLLSPMVGHIEAAHAVVPAGQVVVAAGGSDTTEKMMNDLSAAYDSTQVPVPVGGAATTVRFFNIPTDPKPSPFVVPGDTGNGCNADQNWVKDPLAPGSNTAPTLGTSPFGSTAGRKYLAAENGGTLAANPGCIDVARASNAPPQAADLASFENYAYAMDAVSWASTSLKAPPTLTLAQLQGIYNCTFTDWSQVGGIAGPIQRYFPQVGSGTRSFFNTDILGQASGYAPPNPGGACANVKLIEENQGNGGILGTPNSIVDADIDKAVLPYSAAVWSFQEFNRINPTLDRRKGARLGGITTTSTPAVVASPIAWDGVGRTYFLDTATVVKETNITINANTANPIAFPGIRYVWNVLDNLGPTNSYAAAFGLFGFTNTTATGAYKSPTCNNGASVTDPRGQAAYFAILSNGFAPLGTADAPNAGTGRNVAGSTCRLING